ncbi:MAG TPA: serine hydrolase domain-containing protein [Polyangiaceae bacterium]
MRTRFVSVPLGLVAISACGELEIGSYGGIGRAGALSGAGPTITAGSGATPTAAGADSGSAGSAGVSSAGGAAGSSGGYAGGGEGASGAEGGSATNGGAGPLSGLFDSADIGDTGAPGATAFEEGVYTIAASGADIQNDADSFRFLYAGLTGDGQVVARIEDLTPVHSWTKVGVMIRDSLAPGAKNAFLLLRPSEGSAFQHRPGTNVPTLSTWQESPVDLTPEHGVRYLKPPKWLKLTRQGHEFSAYSSDDGRCWWRRFTQSLAFDDGEAYFGVALTAASYGQIANASVTNLHVSSTIEPDNVQCERARADGDLSPPAAEDWIVLPGRFGRPGSDDPGWDYTGENPNGTPSGMKCEPWAEDEPNSWIVPRTDGPDHPNCPDPSVSPDWTRFEYDYGPSWEVDTDAGIGPPPAQASDVLVTFVEGRGLWLRRKFSLESELQKDHLMLWGRWADGITVYVNGVLATWNGTGTAEYKYLGLSDEARAALVVGENVIAVRVEWDRYHFWEQDGVIEGAAWDRFFDLGLAANDRLSHLPLDRAAEPNAGVAAYVDTVKEFLQEQGISGATFAISKNGVGVASAGLGWHDKNLDVPMARGAKLRLASNDEIITQAAIAKLVNEGKLTPSTRVFERLGLAPIPLHSPGANVDLITVEHLRTHTSGIGATVHHQTMLDELAFQFGIGPEEWTSEHNARWLYSLDADVGNSAGSPRDAYFLLRYLAERLVEPRTLQEYLAGDMGLSGIGVSHERLDGREPNEGYVTREPTWDRWLALENYLALSASAEAYASFLDDFPLSYTLTPEGRYEPVDGGGVIGAMPGTWSVAIEDPSRGLGIVMIANSHGNFEEVVARIDRITYEGSPCLFGHEDPRALLQNLHFIENVGQPELYVNLESGLAASPALAGNWSAQWRLEPVGETRFRLMNRWTEQHLVIEDGLLVVGELEPSSLGAEWQLVPVGDAFQIRNHGANELLYVEDGVLASSASATGASAEWRFCN